MASGKNVLKRLVTLCDMGKLSDAQVHGLLNGVLINGKDTYKDGMVVDKHGGVRTLSVDTISKIERKKEKVIEAKVKVEKTIKVEPLNKPDVDIRQKP